MWFLCILFDFWNTFIIDRTVQILTVNKFDTSFTEPLSQSAQANEPELVEVEFYGFVGLMLLLGVN
jgi:hypothetical protein